MISVDPHELLTMLAELEHLRQRVTDLQKRGTELLLENRALKKRVTELEDTRDDEVADARGDALDRGE